MTRIDVVSGFLGSGKTTAIKKLISESYSNGRIVVLLNEYGKVHIDVEFMRTSGISVAEMTSGCICCNSSGDFRTKIMDIVGWQSPDYIIIEPSAMAKMSEIKKMVTELSEANPHDEIILGAMIDVVDAKRVRSCVRNYGDFYVDQIEHANCIMLSHTDDMSSEDIADCVKLLREHNKDAVIISESWSELDGQMILDAAMQHEISA